MSQAVTVVGFVNKLSGGRWRANDLEATQRLVVAVYDGGASEIKETASVQHLQWKPCFARELEGDWSETQCANRFGSNTRISL